MITQTQTPKTHTSGCECDDCTSARRNRFFRGKSMRAEEFRLEQTYGIERRRLITRAIAGWGVVYGFSMRQEDPPNPKAFTVGSGLALDRHGREIELRSPVVLGSTNTVIVQPGKARCQFQTLDKVERNGEYLLKAHYAERRYGDVPSSDDCGCEDTQQKYVCESVLFTLTRLEHGKCPCEERKCRRKCSCRPLPKDQPKEPPYKADDKDRPYQQESPKYAQQETDWRKDPYATDQGEHDHEHEHDHGERRPCGCYGRGPHACLCEWAEHTTGPELDGALCEWNDYSIDPLDGVALACVRVWTTDDTCYPTGIEAIDACDPRRIVKSNDLLYDLLRGCDLTRISYVSWHEWHRSSDRVEWADFADMFTVEDDGYGHPQVRSKFVVRFSGPVRQDTIARDAVTLTAITMDPDSGWRTPRRIPIAKIDKTPTRDMPEGYTDQFRLYVTHRWHADEIRKDSHSWLTGRGFSIEIEIHGDLIVDCHCQTVDANAVGLAAAPTGNGTPGGTYRSSFWVKPRKDDDSWKDSEGA